MDFYNNNTNRFDTATAEDLLRMVGITPNNNSNMKTTDKESPVCSVCNESADFGQRGDGPALQYPLNAGQTHRLEDPNFGSVIFCSAKCAESRGFDPESDEIPEEGAKS